MVTLGLTATRVRFVLRSFALPAYVPPWFHPFLLSVINRPAVSVFDTDGLLITGLGGRNWLWGKGKVSPEALTLSAARL